MTVVCHRFVYKRRGDNSDAPNPCLGLSLVEPMRLLDSVSDDCVINISKALSLFCVLVVAYVMTCVCLCCLVSDVFKPCLLCVGCDDLCFILILNLYWLCVVCVCYVCVLFLV